MNSQFHSARSKPLAKGKSYLTSIAILQRMAYSAVKVAGVIFLIAVAQFVLGLTIAEALYPGYSIHGNYVSDLGIGPSSVVFNSSAFLLGLLALIGAYLLIHVPNFKTVNIHFFIMAIGVMGVGLITKQYTVPHAAVSSIAFFFAGLSAIASAKFVKQPFSFLGIVLGAMTIGALGLFSIGIITSGSMTSDIAYDSILYLGLGPGGMERMIAYPVLMWLAGFGGYLVAK